MFHGSKASSPIRADLKKSKGTSLNVTNGAHHKNKTSIVSHTLLPESPTLLLQREPPQVKMTARMNSLPHSFTP